jgi:hypothetical protein
MAGCKRIVATCKCIALGNSREPPATTFFGRVDVAAKFAGLAAYVPKRLPSRPWQHSRLVNADSPFEDEDDEYEHEALISH